MPITAFTTDNRAIVSSTSKETKYRPDGSRETVTVDGLPLNRRDQRILSGSDCFASLSDCPSHFIPHTAERLVQVHDLLRRRVKAVAIGTIGHSQIKFLFVMLVKQQLKKKEAVLTDGPLSLLGLKAGVSREKSHETWLHHRLRAGRSRLTELF